MSRNKAIGFLNARFYSKTRANYSKLAIVASIMIANFKFCVATNLQENFKLYIYRISSYIAISIHVGLGTRILHLGIQFPCFLNFYVVPK